MCGTNILTDVWTNLVNIMWQLSHLIPFDWLCRNEIKELAAFVDVADVVYLNTLKLSCTTVCFRARTQPYPSVKLVTLVLKSVGTATCDVVLLQHLFSTRSWQHMLL
jgi:hypothetical protein